MLVFNLMRLAPRLFFFLSLRTLFCAQPGELDPSFNPVLPPEVGTINCLLEQPDGKILVGASLKTVVAAPKTLSRLNPDGTVDTTFQAPSILGNIYCVALDSAGRILAGGEFTGLNGRAVFSPLIRLNQDGTVDTAFKTAISGNVTSLTVQPDDRVFITGTFTSVDAVGRNAVARLQTNGSLDPSFSTKAATGSSNSIILEPDGNLLLISSFSMSSLVRLDPNGRTAMTFGLPFLGPYQISEQADGRILVIDIGKRLSLDSIYIPRLFRMNHDGTSDPSFNAILDIQRVSFGSVLSPVVLQPDRKLLFAAWGFVNGATVNGLVRLEGNGQIDSDFKLDLIYSPQVIIALLRNGDILEGGEGVIRRVHGGNPSPRAPAITIDPQTQTVISGNNLSLAAAATGYPRFYQWRQNGVELPGATNSSLILFNAQPSAAGSYTMVVANALGSVETKPAVISIVAPSSLPNLVKDSGFESLPSSTGAFSSSSWSIGNGAVFGYPRDALLNYMGTQTPLDGVNYAGLSSDFSTTLTGSLSPATTSAQPYELTSAFSLGDFSSSNQAVVRISLRNSSNLDQLGQIVVTNQSGWQVYTQRFVSGSSYTAVNIRTVFRGEFVYVDQVAIRPMVESTAILSSRGQLAVIGDSLLLSVEPVSNSQVHFQVLGRAGAIYDLENTSSLSPPAWQLDQTLTLTNAMQTRHHSIRARQCVFIVSDPGKRATHGLWQHGRDGVEESRERAARNRMRTGNSTIIREQDCQNYSQAVAALPSG